MGDRGGSLTPPRRSRAAAALLGALALPTACTDQPSEIGPGTIVAVRMSADSLDLRVGRTVLLGAFPLDGSDAFRPDRPVTWSSDAPDVATVDGAGLVTGVREGLAAIVAEADGHEGRTRIRVAAPPQLGFTRDTVVITASAGGGDPAPDSVGIVNLGDLVLAGLTIDTVIYGPGATDWLTAVLDAASAPATLRLTVTAGAITAAGTYLATVTVSAVDAESSPRSLSVRLEMGPGPAAALAINDGDGQTAVVGSPVAVPPSVRVADTFGNPVAGAEVTFAVTAGGGSVTGAVAASGADGVAQAGSWTLGTAAGMNRLAAALAGGPSVEFTATGAPGAATQMALQSGNNQSAVAGSPVGMPPAVLVADAFGNGVPGVTVTFTVASGGGSVTAATPVTDAAGVAAVGSWTLGPAAGPNTLDAAVPGLAGSPVTFSATGLSGDAKNLVLEAGDMQTDTVGATLPVPYAVKVTDENGNGVAGVDVGWSVTGGGGAITPSSSTTDADGIAVAQRVLGTAAGAQTAQASVGGLVGSPVTFTATAQAGAAASITVAAGDGQAATVNTAVAVPPSVLVADQFGNPVPGHAVTFAVATGGGAVNPTAAVMTGSNGIAAVTSWTLGTVAGTNNNTLAATAAGGGIAGNPATFTASATAGPAAAVAVLAGNNETAVTGTPVPTDPAVTVTDQFGNPVGGITVSFAVTGGGGNVTGATPVTDASGVATLGSWTVRASGAGDAQGRTGNTLRASINAGAVFVDFAASAVYSYAMHVHPIWAGTGSCTGCHGGLSGLTLSGDAASTYAALVGVNPVCDTDGTLVPQGYRRIATGGGTAAEGLSVLLAFVDPPTPLPGNCDAQYMPTSQGLPAATRDTIRAWIRNTAPNN